MGVPEKLLKRHPFPGPGLSVRIMGEITPSKLAICRKASRIVTVRVVDSIDAMTADWTRLPNGVLEKISNRITNEIDEVTWVSYVISSKPPATIEPQ